ncbi:hypothetical protein BC830DRAFT_335821 [Chytriomyces sp. MP71]|nr:hypothetical protein BC830DRAFT_335821 [Chytriomyces sp. MP71]
MGQNESMPQPPAGEGGGSGPSAAEAEHGKSDVFAALLSQALNAANFASGGGESTAVVIGSLSDAVKSLARSQARSVRVVIGGGEDFVAERDVLVSFVWPFLARFCKVLELDFAVVDLCVNWLPIPASLAPSQPELLHLWMTRCKQALYIHGRMSKHDGIEFDSVACDVEDP